MEMVRELLISSSIENKGGRPSAQVSYRGIGHVRAQYITSATAKKRRLKFKNAELGSKIDWKRVAVTSMFGIGFVGPFGHYWYEGLERFIKTKIQLLPKTTKFDAGKVAIDGVIFTPFDLLLFFSYMGLSTGKSVPQVKRDFLPALILEGSIWPVVQTANFRYVPVRYQLHYVNIFCLLDCALWSWIQQQDDAPWKQRLGGGQRRW